MSTVYADNDELSGFLMISESLVLEALTAVCTALQEVKDAEYSERACEVEFKAKRELLTRRRPLIAKPSISSSAGVTSTVQDSASSISSPPFTQMTLNPFDGMATDPSDTVPEPGSLTSPPSPTQLNEPEVRHVPDGMNPADLPAKRAAAFKRLQEVEGNISRNGPGSNIVRVDNAQEMLDRLKVLKANAPDEDLRELATRLFSLLQVGFEACRDR